MSFQIKDVVLYSHAGEKRTLKLSTGKLNIITGSSKTGKTAIISILEYCFGSKKCEIPVGKIRSAVKWVGVRLEVFDGQVFVARRVPDPGRQSSADVYYAVGSQVEIPEGNQLIQIVNTETLKDLLTAHAGISLNRYDPPAGQTRGSLSAGIHLALIYCFQHQAEIVNNQFLFHRQNESSYLSQAIKDTISFFLGDVNEDYVAKKDELHRCRREQKQLELRLKDFDSIRGEGMMVASNLLSEAKDFGMKADPVAPKTWDDYLQALRNLPKPTHVSDIEEIASEGDEFKMLQRRHEELSDDLKETKNQLDAVKELARNRQEYSKEANAQVLRLKSIRLFNEPHDGSHNACPLCQQTLRSEDVPPSVQSINSTLEKLETQIRQVEERTPEMQSVINTLEGEVLKTETKIRQNKNHLKAIQREHARLQEYRDQNARKAHILGRVSLYLDSVQVENSSNLQSQITTLQKNEKALEKELSDQEVNNRTRLTLSKISEYMNKWAKRLQLEHSKSRLRIDLSRLTVVAEGPDGHQIPMNVTGSGESWVGYHLIAHLALHRLFIDKNRPVPRFIFVDQPSQVYFPEDKALESQENGSTEADEDMQKVKEIYRLVYDVVKELDNRLQVIITDHANILEDWFRDCIVERWRDGEFLVPPEWKSHEALRG